MNYVTHTHQYVSGDRITHTHLFKPGHYHDYLDDQDRRTGFSLGAAKRKSDYEELYDGYLAMTDGLPIDAAQRMFAVRRVRMVGNASINALAALDALRDYLSAQGVGIVVE